MQKTFGGNRLYLSLYKRIADVTALLHPQWLQTTPVSRSFHDEVALEDHQPLKALRAI
jgi:hypothetical protein